MRKKLTKHGNKRVGAMTAYVFLALNGYDLNTPQEELADTVVALACGERSKAEFTLFLRALSKSATGLTNTYDTRPSAYSTRVARIRTYASNGAKEA